MKAAITLLAITPYAATLALQTISDRNEYPHAAYARGMLESVEDGSYVPDELSSRDGKWLKWRPR